MNPMNPNQPLRPTREQITTAINNELKDLETKVAITHTMTAKLNAVATRLHVHSIPDFPSSETEKTLSALCAGLMVLVEVYLTSQTIQLDEMQKRQKALNSALENVDRHVVIPGLHGQN